MKKFLGVLVVSVSILVVMGCASSGKGASGGAPPPKSQPDFVANPGKYKIEGAFTGIGSAKFETTNMTMTMAENRAMAAITRRISSNLKNMIEDYNAAVEGDPAAAEAFAQVVTRALSEAKLSDTEVEMTGYDDNGTYYVLMSMPKSAALRPAAVVIDREKVQYAKFQNWNAQRDMQAAFAAENGDPEIVDRDD
jgi:hypothetical protein